jgi:ATP-dependent RNA helicase DHX29
MAPKKKKAKASANNARGFATTSQPSKVRAVETPNDNDGASTPVSADNTAAGGQAEGLVRSNAGSGQPSIQQMTPEELEQHLEDAELQDILDRTGARCRAESSRQVSRMKTERRQLRPQSHRLHTEDWLADNLVERIVVRESKSEATSHVPSKSSLPSNDEKMLTDLWILHRVLTGLGLPKIQSAISHVIHLAFRGRLVQNTYIPYGLTEALDWYAINCFENELPDYEDRISTRPPTPTGTEPVANADMSKCLLVSRHIMTNTCSSARPDRLRVRHTRGEGCAVEHWRHIFRSYRQRGLL